MARQGFVIYHDSIKRIGKLSLEQKGRLLDALCEYSCTGNEILSEDNELAVWFVFDPMRNAIDRDAEKYENKSRAGKCNADTRWEKTMPTDANVCQPMPTDANAMPNNAVASTGTQSQTGTQSEPQSQTESETKTKQDTGTVVASAPPRTPKSPKPSKRFVPPTVEEVAAYCAERHNSIDPEYFCAWYEARGWKQNNGKSIESWKATVITWEKRDKERGGNNGRPNAANRGAAVGVGDKPDALGTWDINGRTIL